jgi:uncharacterized cupredoxin-like copper-binding protein
MRTKLFVIAGVAAFALTTAGCGSDVGMGTEDDPRTIEVTALDELAFDPETIEVGAGETVRFVVKNTGELEHEFVVGDTETQDMAEEQMGEGMHDHVDAMASVSIGPGESAETTVTFGEAGELFYACHVEGHYDGGMVGTITIT